MPNFSRAAAVLAATLFSVCLWPAVPQAQTSFTICKWVTGGATAQTRREAQGRAFQQVRASANQHARGGYSTASKVLMVCRRRPQDWACSARQKVCKKR